MKSRILLCLFFLIALLLPRLDCVNLRTILTSAFYYPAYPDYDFESPVIGANLNLDILDLYEGYGIGGSIFYQISSYHNYFQDLRTYEIYLHNFINDSDKDSYFIYGFFAGIKQTDLYYEDYRENYNIDLFMIRPLIGFHYSNPNWGTTLKWTQRDNKKSRFEYELKYRNPTGLIFQIGGSFKGPVQGAKSDFHIYAGYEFYI